MWRSILLREKPCQQSFVDIIGVYKGRYFGAELVLPEKRTSIEPEGLNIEGYWGGADCFPSLPARVWGAL